MSILAAFIGATRTPLDDITANWGDITFTSPTSVANNANVTITFTAGSPRTLVADYAGLLNNLEYRIDSGSYTSCPPGTEFTVTSGQTVNFRYGSTTNESVTVTIRDKFDGNRTIDTFNVSVSGY